MSRGFKITEGTKNQFFLSGFVPSLFLVLLICSCTLDPLVPCALYLVPFALTIVLVFEAGAAVVVAAC